ncbi:MAG: transcriptional regulator Crp [Betaproteobacteria bacterium]|nr:transcriptional regulator Crp [Betaproteobacteria bacterium]
MPEAARALHELEPFLAHCRVRQYAARAPIIRQGDAATELFLIVRGSVSVMLADEHGREIVLAYLNAGEFFGEIGLFVQDEGRSALVRARSDCAVAQISYVRLRELTELYPQVLIAMTGQLARRLRATNRKLGDLAFMDVYGRLAHALLELCEQPDAEVQAAGTLVRVTQQELARLIGCSREMVGKVLKEMEQQKHVVLQGRSILLPGVKPKSRGTGRAVAK